MRGHDGTARLHPTARQYEVILDGVTVGWLLKRYRESEGWRTEAGWFWEYEDDGDFSHYTGGRMWRKLAEARRYIGARIQPAPTP